MILKSETLNEYNVTGEDGSLKATITFGINAIAIENLEKTKKVVIYLDDLSVEAGLDELELTSENFGGR